MLYATTDHFKCFECGDIGHKRQFCPHKQTENEQQPTATPENVSSNKDASESVADTAGDTVTWKKKQVAKKRRLLQEDNGHKQVSESDDDAESSEQAGNSAAVVMSVSDVVAKVVENENVTDVHTVEKDDDLDGLSQCTEDSMRDDEQWSEGLEMSKVASEDL
ncbi:Transposon TX1 uncharacterized 82 kDa protein [Labeo rohita]|uniref:Transposon TX1 uncharacterized 82 kDa protein n=1 Tax=Labeo rohita TaxID=84645 RepID=A0ABQ8N1I3_LABRO|nr:Transposon TX1 uncharacterized 82 kDa protein [Labeo rohita]